MVLRWRGSRERRAGISSPSRETRAILVLDERSEERYATSFRGARGDEFPPSPTGRELPLGMHAKWQFPSLSRRGNPLRGEGTEGEGLSPLPRTKRGANRGRHSRFRVMPRGNLGPVPGIVPLSFRKAWTIPGTGPRLPRGITLNREWRPRFATLPRL